MSQTGKLATILMAEDELSDQRLVLEEFKQAKLANPLHIVENGKDLLAYLHGEGDFADRVKYPLPDLILLDLNMPIVDGRTALREIKRTPELNHIPVIVMTGSRNDADVFKSYEEGAVSFVTKPIGLFELTNALKLLSDYWFGIVVPPTD